MKSPMKNPKKEMKQILIVGPAWVGDMVMAQPLFIALKNQFPDLAIDVLAPDWSRPLLERMPEVRQAIVMPIGHGALQLAARYQLAQTLKPRHYDQAIVLPNSWKSALIPCWAKIPKRSGWRGEMRWGLLNDLRILDKKALPKMVQRFVALAYPNGEFKASDSYPIPSLRTRKETVEQTGLKFSISEDFNFSKPFSKRIVALCPGAEFGPSKRWPEQHFAELALTKLKEGFAVWLFGSKNDMPISEAIQIATEGRCVDFTGKTTLGEAIDLLSLATVVVSNDSGLMHIAAALDKPLVALYGSTDPGFTPPLSRKVKNVKLNLSCSPCFKRTCPLEHHRCMKELKADTVSTDLKILGEECGF